MTQLQKTKAWFEQAIPEPTIEQACIQIGCHYEEIYEMASCLFDAHAMDATYDHSTDYKEAREKSLEKLSNMPASTKEELLDSLVDQIVTAVGVGHMLGMDVLRAIEEVNRSNFSKFENGKAVFDENGKITKGKNYVKQNLKPFV